MTEPDAFDTWLKRFEQHFRLPPGMLSPRHLDARRLDKTIIATEAARLTGLSHSLDTECPYRSPRLVVAFVRGQVERAHGIRTGTIVPLGAGDEIE